MPPISKTRHLPFNPPRQLSTVGDPPASKSKSKSKKRGPPAEGDPSSSRSGGNSSKKRRSARVSPSPSRDHAPEEQEQEQEQEAHVASSSSASVSASGSSPAEERSQPPDNASPEPDYMLAEITTTGAVDDEDIMTSEPKVPSKLVTALLHHHFQDDKTRVTKDAMRVYAKYLEIFVREAVARAVYEKQEVLDADAVGANTVQNTLDGYLEVEDLEKLVPQLLMDF